MLDTNIVSELARRPHGTVARKIAEAGSDTICVSIICAAELRYGCAKKGSQKLTAQIEAILGAVQIPPFNAPADVEYGRLRASLESAGTPIGPNDMLIAAHALALDAVLVTANTAEFARVSGLTVENWIA